MKTIWIHRIAKNFTAEVISLLWLLALVLTGCNSDTEGLDPTAEEGDSILVELRLYIPGSGATRTAEFYEEEGTGLENYINPKSVTLWLADKSSCGGIVQARIYATQVDKDLQNPNEYIVYGYADYTNGSDYNINNTVSQTLYVMVNTDDVDTPAAGTYYTNFFQSISCDYGVYNYINGDEDGNVVAPYIPSREKPIPMYGCKSVGQLNLVKSKTRQALGTISLLRAVSKVTIRGGNVDLDNVYLSRVYQYGFTCPYGMLSMNTTQSSSSYLNVPGVNRYYDSSQLSNGLTEDYLVPKTILKNYPFTKIEDEDGTYWVAYVPEYNNVTTLTKSRNYIPLKSSGVSYSSMTNTAKWDTDDEAKICFDMKCGGDDPVTLSEEIRFRDYSDATVRYDLVRNTHYDFTVSYTGKLQYSVLKWDNYTAGDIIFK